MVREGSLRRGDVCLFQLDPTVGSEIRKTRPCVIVSPDEMNRHSRTVIIAPMTSATRNYPTRIDIEFRGTHGQIVLDQIRTVDTTRLVKKMGQIDMRAMMIALDRLQKVFAP